MFRSKSILIVICFFIFNCCKNNTESSSKNNIRFDLKPQSAAKYYYTVNRLIKTELEIDDNTIKNDNSSTIGFIYQKIKDSADCFIMQITYDQLHILSKTKDDEKEINAAPSSFDPVEKILGTILGSSVYIVVNKHGDVLRTSGTDEIKENIITALNTEDAVTINAVQDQLSKLVGETFFKNNLEQGFKLLPDSALSIGDHWSRKSKQSADITFDANTTYTLKSVSGKIARVEGKGIINSNENQASVMGYRVSTNLKGSQTSQFEIDINSGLLMKEDSKSSTKGTINILGREVPIEINLKNTVSVTKM